MTFRQIAALVLVAAAVSACKRRTAPVEAPAPVASTTSDADARARARADSIAAADRARREAEERERAATIARVREALSDVVYFEYDSDRLTSEAQAKLQTKAAIMRVNPSLQVRVEGHTDERGTTEYNVVLSQRRAESVRDFLAGYGIDASRVSTIPFGEERPAAEGSGESAWARNRRAEFVVTGGQIVNAPPEVR